jgi:hypothetical protein
MARCFASFNILDLLGFVFLLQKLSLSTSVDEVDGELVGSSDSFRATHRFPSFLHLLFNRLRLTPRSDR